MRCIVTRKYGVLVFVWFAVVLLSSGCRVLMPIDDVEKSVCGDDLKDSGEACDGTDLGGQSCVSLGFLGGTVSCNADCTLNSEACSNAACGNGVLDDGETCDPGVGGPVEGCDAVCQVVVGWSCEGSPSVCVTVCSDNLIAGDEECDGTDLGTATCESTGHGGGTLACDAQCRLDFSQCHSFTAITCGGDHCCLLQSSGELLCWGGNANGQIGDGTTTDRRRPVGIPDFGSVTAINAAAGTTCAVSDLTTPGEPRMYCWGSNDAGAMGVGDAGILSSDVPMVLPWSETLPTAEPVRIAGMGPHQCVRLSDDAVACWGFNDAGQIGDQQAGQDALSPVILTGVGGIARISGGMNHTCAVRTEASVASNLLCWGDNASGQLGDGSGEDQLTPVEVEGFYESVACGAGFTCAVSTDHRVWCWGRNNFGQLGIGNTSNQPLPVEVTLSAEAASVTVGFDHACALLVTGEVACWGRNRSGQLGDATTTDRTSPVLLDTLAEVAGLAAGHNHTCAYLLDQTAYCWGSNADGQLGVDNNRPSINTPTAVVF